MCVDAAGNAESVKTQSYVISSGGGSSIVWSGMIWENDEYRGAVTSVNAVSPNLLHFEMVYGNSGDLTLSGATVSGGISFSGASCSVHDSSLDCGTDGALTFRGATLSYEGDPADFSKSYWQEAYPDYVNPSRLTLLFYDPNAVSYTGGTLTLTPK